MMRLKATGNGVRAIAWLSFLGLNVVAIIATALIQIAAVLPLGTFINVIIIGFAALLALLLVRTLYGTSVGSLLRTDRLFGAISRGDLGRVPRPLTPLSPAGALLAGETVTLRRQVAGKRLTRILGFFALTVGIVIVLSVLLPLTFITRALAEPTIVQPLLAPVADFLPFVLLGIPLVSGIFFLFLVWVQIWSERDHTIIADDAGITVRRTWHRTRFIPWNDIKVVLRSGGIFSRPELMSYLLWGEQHGLSLTFASEFILGNSNFAARSSTTYEGGAEAYAANARRLLATIAARSPGAIMAVFPNGFYSRHPLLRNVGTGLTLDDVMTLPLAEPAAQPDPTRPPSPFVQGMWATTRRITLWPKAQVAVSGQIAAIVLVLLLVVLLVSQVTADANSPLFSNDVALQVGALIPSTVILVFVVTLIIQSRSARRRGYPLALPAVWADDVGLALFQPTTRQQAQQAAMRNAVVVPWGDVRAWAVLPPSPAKPTVTVYCVFGEGVTLQWVERAGADLANPGLQGDPQAAYTLTAEGLHAMIASRTGLPLRVLPQPQGW